MPIYKENNRYIVKVSVHGRQIMRKQYLGKAILDKQTALECEKDLYIKYSFCLTEYFI